MRTFSLFATGLVAFVVGCAESPPGRSAATGHTDHSHPASSDAQAALAKLTPEDRQVAEAQGYCVVTEETLGSMGVPIKVAVKDQVVFVCCEGCADKVRSQPAEMLAKAATFKSKVAAEQAQN